MMSKLFKKIAQNHSVDDYPCLYAQYERFLKDKPLEGKIIMHSVPLFNNALPKIASLLASGAKIISSVSPAGSFDPETIATMKDINLSVVDKISENSNIDLILDCAGSCAFITPKIGAVELTRSGEYYYANKEYPVISADRSKIKAIEDMLGTSDGFIRALENTKLLPSSGSTILLFGHGKVGNGIANKLSELKANVIVVDKADVISKINNFETISCLDVNLIYERLKKCNYVVTCTGVKSVIETNYDWHNFVNSDAVLINMGAEDEFGPSFPNNRVMNNKRPFNFILKEPTRLKYLDATFALHIECAIYLSQTKKLSKGIISPPKFIEDKILQSSPFKTLI